MLFTCENFFFYLSSSPHCFAQHLTNTFRFRLRLRAQLSFQTATNSSRPTLAEVQIQA